MATAPPELPSGGRASGGAILLLEGLLAFSVIAAFATGARGAGLPHLAGAGLAVFLGGFRIIYGLVGPPISRLRLAGPKALAEDAAALVRLRPREWGRRPVVAVSLIAVLSGLVLSAMSGALTASEGGPGKGIIIGVPPAFADAPGVPAATGPDAAQWSFHGATSRVTLGLACLHLGALTLAFGAARALPPT